MGVIIKPSNRWAIKQVLDKWGCEYTDLDCPSYGGVDVGYQGVHYGKIHIDKLEWQIPRNIDNKIILRIANGISQIVGKDMVIYIMPYTAGTSKYYCSTFHWMHHRKECISHWWNLYEQIQVTCSSCGESYEYYNSNA